MLPITNLRYLVSDTSSENPPGSSHQEGLALLIAVIALSVFSLLGLYVSLNATTEVRISENYESRQQARLAARAGLNHARELIRGLELNDLLRGPDGLKPDPSTYPSTLSGQYAFRNWVGWSTARSLNILNPASAVSGLPDDGLFNSGGTILIPATGVALTAPNPYGAGTVTTARYFVKVTDNDDGDGDRFTDSDGIVIVRSTGVAQTIRETAAGVVRANSVAVYEARFKRSQTFGIHAPIILEGDPVVPAKSTNMFGGNSFSIDGGAYPYGIGTIDTDTSNTSYPDAEVKANLDPKYYDQITGSCCASTGGAVGDITGTLTGDQLLLKDPAYLWNFIYNVIPKFADSVFQGDQQWSGSGVPPLGTPQSPRLTYVNGDLAMGGGVSGTGVLVVNGELKGNGKNDWTGLILVIGKGVANMSGMNIGINGGIYVVSLQAGNPPTFGTTQFSLGGNSNVQASDTALHLGIENLPPVEVSRREVTSSMDP